MNILLSISPLHTVAFKFSTIYIHSITQRPHNTAPVCGKQELTSTIISKLLL